MKSIRMMAMGVAVSGCLGGPAVASGPIAAPQSRGTWADSTHVTGVARRVMPEIPTASSPVEPDIGLPSAPSTVQELLERMNGADLYYREVWDSRSGWNELPSVLRVQVRAGQADIQTHNMWNNTWYSLCSLTSLNTLCHLSLSGARISMIIAPSGLTATGAGCESWMSGSVSAWATYNWDHYLARAGAFANQNQSLQPVDNGYQGYFFQSGSFASTCYVEMPG